jgi:hypothetical protein
MWSFGNASLFIRSRRMENVGNKCLFIRWRSQGMEKIGHAYLYGPGECRTLGISAYLYGPREEYSIQHGEWERVCKGLFGVWKLMRQAVSCLIRTERNQLPFDLQGNWKRSTLPPAQALAIHLDPHPLALGPSYSIPPPPPPPPLNIEKNISFQPIAV